MKKIGILYICTGKYDIFWKDFYQSSEKFFLNNSSYEKHYFVFTDAKNLAFDTSSNVHKIYQEALDWPYSTLYRFKMFDAISEQLENMDYLFFFNANMVFVDRVDKDFLPQGDYSFSFLQHPGFYDKPREQLTYETNPNSLAYIDAKEGQYYFAGGLNGGLTKEYLAMIKTLNNNINIDEKNNIIALWHDESHINRFGVDYQDKIKILDPSYGYPKGCKLPYKAKIIIKQKEDFGGHDFLRDNKVKKRNKLKDIFRHLKLRK